MASTLMATRSSTSLLEAAHKTTVEFWSAEAGITSTLNMAISHYREQNRHNHYCLGSIEVTAPYWLRGMCWVDAYQALRDWVDDLAGRIRFFHRGPRRFLPR